ncbi:D-alanyl-D-alanine carboxypeptidase family protein [Cytobacillus sp. FJAT-54145]|uniref:D-alanyl-D-alanine carboxypeptidase family protein n=1 Tax=Cytobacillus spartinae TaxID=3299023 RepID=A0ABW6K5M8_9BACI
MNDPVTVSKQATEADGTRVYLNEGEIVPLRKLIQGMLINSGNDAAIAIAEHLDGSIESFSKSINTFLKEKVGVENTHFTNPHGLFDDSHVSTAYDLAIITNYAMQNPYFVEIFGTKELTWDGQSWDTTIYSHHRLLKGEIPFEGITGGKTGFVNESKQTLATTAKNKNIHLTAITLKADYKRDIYNDTISLLDFGFGHFKTTFLAKNSEYKNGEETFHLAKDTFITEPLKGSKMNVTEQGKLTVQNESNETVQTVALAVKQDEPIIQEEKKAVEKEVQRDYMNGIYVLIVFGLVVGFVTIRKRRLFR